jgi:hypothetical protein
MMAGDRGARCDAHVGEVFLPRCEACDVAALEAAPPVQQPKPTPPRQPVDLGPADAYGYCPFHPNYPSRPWPCDACARDRQATPTAAVSGTNDRERTRRP